MNSPARQPHPTTPAANRYVGRHRAPAQTTGRQHLKRAGSATAVSAAFLALAAAPSQAAPVSLARAVTAKAPYVVTASLSAVTVPVSQTYKLTGVVRPAAPGARVLLQQYVGSSWRTISTGTLDRSSTYTFTRRAPATVTRTPLRAYVPAGKYAAAASPTRAVYSAKTPFAVSITAPASVRPGATFRISGTVSLSAVGETVYLQRYVPGTGWRTVATQALSRASTYAFPVTAGGAGSRTYRVWKYASGYRLTSTSASRTISVTAPTPTPTTPTPTTPTPTTPTPATPPPAGGGTGAGGGSGTTPPPVPDPSVSSWAGTAGPVAANAQHGYPYPQAPQCTAGGACVADAWNMYQGQCTSWVAFRLNQLNGVKFTNQYGGPGRWGNASNWGARATALAIPVDQAPRVGSIAWYAYGHVAYVERVDSATSVVISEMNFDRGNGFRVRTITAGTAGWPTGFIHLKDR